MLMHGGYIFKRRHWIDPLEQQRTFPSNLGSIHLRAPPRFPPAESKTADLISPALSLSGSLKARDGAVLVKP